MHTIAAFSFKGGVGKTTTAVNLAYTAATAGQRTLLIDLDAQAAATYYFRVRPSSGPSGAQLIGKRRKLFRAIKATDYEGLDLLAAHRSFRYLDIALHEYKHPEQRLRKVLELFGQDYDLIVLDCPPSTSLLSESICFAADVVLIPMIPHPLCRRTLEQLIEMCARRGLKRKRLHPFFSMVQDDNPRHRELMESVRRRYSNLLPVSIPRSASIEEMGIHREPVGSFAADEASTEAYEALFRETSRLLAA